MSQASESRTETKPVIGLTSTRHEDSLTTLEPNTLPPKTARLQQRRKAKTDVAGGELRRSESKERCEVFLITEDGAVSYLLRQQQNVLLVRREQRRPLGVCSTQSITLACRSEFDRWLSTDSVRHDHPLIYERLCAIGRDFFDAQ